MGESNVVGAVDLITELAVLLCSLGASVHVSMCVCVCLAPAWLATGDTSCLQARLRWCRRRIKAQEPGWGHTAGRSAFPSRLETTLLTRWVTAVQSDCVRWSEYLGCSSIDLYYWNDDMAVLSAETKDPNPW